MEIKKYRLFFLILFIAGCSPKITLDYINAPSEANFKKELGQQVAQYKNSPELSKNTLDYETHNFNKRLEARNEALKMIQFEELQRLIIIDKLYSGYSGVIEESFVLNRNSDNFVRIKQSDDEAVKYTIKTEEGVRLDEDVKKVISMFDSDLKNRVSTDDFDKVMRPTFYVTVVEGGKVKYYMLSFSNAYKLIELH